MISQFCTSLTINNINNTINKLIRGYILHLKGLNQAFLSLGLQSSCLRDQDSSFV